MRLILADHVRCACDGTWERRHIDEVHPLIDCTIGREPEKTKDQRCTLKRDRQSLFQSRFTQRLLFTRKRPARTPPSTFLFLPIQFSNNLEIEPDPQLASCPARRRSSCIGQRSDTVSLFQ